jgi:hypothetical protein
MITVDRQGKKETGIFINVTLFFFSVVGLVLAAYIGQRELALPFLVFTDELRLLDVSKLGELSDQTGRSWLPSADERIMRYASCLNSRSEEDCAPMIRSVLNQKPAEGGLWLEYAEVLAREGSADGVTTFEALQQSYNFAPRSRWVAVPRVLFALSIWRTLPEATKVQAKVEAKGMFDDAEFLRSLAEKYSTNLFARSAIEEIMSDASPQQKLRFLRMVGEATSSAN